MCWLVLCIGFSKRWHVCEESLLRDMSVTSTLPWLVYSLGVSPSLLSRSSYSQEGKGSLDNYYLLQDYYTLYSLLLCTVITGRGPCSFLRVRVE